MTNQQEILIKVKSDVDQATKQIGTLTKEVEKLSKSNTKTAGDVDRLGKSFGGLSQTISSVAAAFISFEAAKSFVSTLSEIEQGMIGVAKVTGMSGEELKGLSDGLDTLARKLSGVTIIELQSIAETAGQLGVQGSENILAFTEAVGKIAVATDLTADEAAASMAKLANVLQEPITNTERLGDVINELSNTTTATASDVVEFANRIAGAGESFGLTSDQVFAFAATLKDVGATAEAGGSALSRIMGMMTADVAGFAQASGVSMSEFKRIIQEDPINALNMFISKFGELDKFAQARMLEDLGIGGVETVSVVQKLSIAQEKLNDNLKIAADEYKNGGSLQAEYEIASRSLEAAWSDVKDEMLLLVKASGDQLIPILKDGAEALKEMVQGFEPDSIQNFVDGIILAVDAVKGLYDVVSLLNDVVLPDWLFGENANFLGAIADGYAKIGQNLKLLSQDGTELNGMLASQAKALDDVYAKNAEMLSQGQATKADIEARQDAIKNLVNEMSEELMNLSLKKSAEEDARVSTAATVSATDTLKASIETLKTQYADLNNVRVITKDDATILTDKTTQHAAATADLTIKTKEQKEAEKTLAKERKAQEAEEKKQFEELKKTQLDYWQARLTNINTVLSTQIAAERQLSSELTAAENLRTAAIMQRTQNQIASSQTIMSLYSQEVLDYAAQNTIKDEISRLGREARAAIALGEYTDAQTLYTAQAQLIQDFGQKKQIVHNQEASLADEAMQLLLANRNAQNELSVEQIAASETNIANKQQELTGIQTEIKETESLKVKVKELISQIKESKAEFSIDTKKAMTDIDALYVKTEIPMKSTLDVDDTIAMNTINTFRAIAEKPTNSTHTVKPNTAAAISVINQLKQPTSSVHTVYVKTVGGYSTGGVVSPLVNYLASGGFPKRNGQISGHDKTGRDDVPSMLTQGEYVHRVAAVDYYGRDFMESINRLQFPKISKFADGGSVGVSKTVNVNLTMPDGKTSFSMQTDDQIAASLERYMRKNR